MFCGLDGVELADAVGRLVEGIGLSVTEQNGCESVFSAVRSRDLRVSSLHVTIRCHAQSRPPSCAGIGVEGCRVGFEVLSQVNQLGSYFLIKSLISLVIPLLRTLVRSNTLVFEDVVA